MLKTFLFIWKYKILKNKENLSHEVEKFMKLSNSSQRKIIDKYFEKFQNENNLETYFNDKNARFYQDGMEITFFHCYYFDKKLLEYNPKTLRLFDKFMIEKEKKEYLIKYIIEIIQKENITITKDDLINYKDELPESLSTNLDFMTLLTKEEESNIKYITYNEKCGTRQRELIKERIKSAQKKNYTIRNYLKNDGTLPNILKHDFNFLIYIIENNIENILYIDESIVEYLTSTDKKVLVDTIIKSLNKSKDYFSEIEKISFISDILNKDEDFITYMTNENIDNISYIDWHNIPSQKRERIINNITKQLEEKQIPFKIMKYPFHDLFFQNYHFMKYLIQKDYRWIAITKVSDEKENNELIELFFQQIEDNHYKFRLEDFLEDGKTINHLLVENEKMLSYFFKNRVPIAKYIDFIQISNKKQLTENILKEIEKKDYIFKNEDFLVENKYPIPLSNSYRFMRYVIDKNFNYLSYIDISMIDKKELQRIINYAFRMVYCIRGNNKNLNFDIEGYFQNTPILENEYFQECLKSL